MWNKSPAAHELRVKHVLPTPTATKTISKNGVAAVAAIVALRFV